MQGKSGFERTSPSVCRCGQSWVRPWLGSRYFLNSKDKLRSKKSPVSLVAFLPLLSPSALKVSHSGHLPHTSQHFPLPTSPDLPAPSLSQHPLLPLHLRALPPTSSQVLLFPATPLYSAGDSFSISSTKSSNTVLPLGLRFRKPHPSYCLRFTPPLQPRLQCASELRVRF